MATDRDRENEKLKVLNFSDPDEMQGHVEKLKRTLPYMLQYSEIVSQYRWKQYNEYLKVGFTEEQALDLCKSSLM